MQLSYELLFGVIFNHQYYTSNYYIFLKPTPSALTATIFYKYGLIFKPHATGFLILFETYFAGRKRTRKEMLQTTLTLRFLIENADPYFCIYTNNFDKYDPYCSILNFKNNTNKLDTGKLHCKEFVDAAFDQLSASELETISGFKKPFSIIDIALEEVATDAYSIWFEAKKTYWRYALTTQHLLELESPAILNKADKTLFEGPVSCLLPDGRKAILFTSRQPIALSEQPNRDLQLVENYNPVSGKYKIVVSRLPNPDIKNISAINVAGNKQERVRYAEIII